MRQALATQEDLLGADSPELAASLTELAIFYRQQGRHADAEPLLRRAFELRRRALELDHPDLTRAREQLAITLLRLGRPADARPIIDEIRTFGGRDPKLRDLAGEHGLTGDQGYD